MAALVSNLGKWISKIPGHSVKLPPEAERPLAHYVRGANDHWNLLLYFRRLGTKSNTYEDPFSNHMVRLRALVLLAMVESFERFLKELAASCINQIAPLVTDDRLSAFKPTWRSVAAQFAEQDLGRALTEGDTWLDVDEIVNRFRRLLAEPGGMGSGFELLPSNPRDADYWRRTALAIVFQLRHSIAHNVGVITRSDAAKLRIMCKGPVDAPRLLELTQADVWYTKLFLDELATWINGNVAGRAAAVLTQLHSGDASLFDPAQRAAELARIMGVPVRVGGVNASP